MERKPSLLEAIHQKLSHPENRNYDYPANQAMPFSPEFEQLIQKYGVNAIDAAWFAIPYASNIEFDVGRIGHISGVVSEAFDTQLTLQIRNGSSIGNHAVGHALSHRKVLIQSNSHISVLTGLLFGGCTIV